MQSSSAPTKIALPFANTSGARRAIPTASQIGITPGAASLTDGFPPLTRTALSSGGVPPSGLDMNGVLYLLSASDQWVQAGGQPTYDSTFSTAIGGYPLGAVLKSVDGLTWWRSTAENNTNNPDTGGANWVNDLFKAATAAVDTNTTQIATTAFVLGQLSAAGDGNPAMDGTAARGSSTHGARADHVHPSDTALLSKVGGTMTGALVLDTASVSTAPTAAPGTNTTQIASTAFVQAAISALIQHAAVYNDVLSGATLTANLALTPGTWLVDASAGIRSTIYWAETLSIDGTAVQSMPNRGDTVGTDIHPMGGFLQVVVTSSRNVPVTYSQESGGDNFPTFIKAIAYKVA